MRAVNLCVPCGTESQFCCPSESGLWVCEGGLACLTIANPYDNVNSSMPYGLARICTASTSDQSGEPS